MFTLRQRCHFGWKIIFCIRATCPVERATHFSQAYKVRLVALTTYFIHCPCLYFQVTHLVQQIVRIRRTVCGKIRKHYVHTPSFRKSTSVFLFLPFLSMLVNDAFFGSDHAPLIIAVRNLNRFMLTH